MKQYDPMARAADPEDARVQLVATVMALATVRQFLAQSPEAQTPEILVQDIGGITGCVLAPEVGPVPAFVSFNLTDGSGEMHLCLCDPASFALLLLVIVFGQSVFIDRSSKGGKPYVKVFGKNNTSAGTVFARIVFGAEAMETVTYEDDNALDLRHANLVPGRPNQRARSGAAEWNAEALFLAQSAPNEVLPGTPEAKVATAKELLQALRERIIAEQAGTAASPA